LGLGFRPFRTNWFIVGKLLLPLAIPLLR
jgi:hypothetical protein